MFIYCLKNCLTNYTQSFGIALIAASLYPGPPYEPRENITRFSDVFMTTNRVCAIYLPITTFYVGRLAKLV
jgi:hypothetical protein